MAEFQIEPGDMLALEHLGNGQYLEAVVTDSSAIHDAQTGEVIRILLALSPEEEA